MNHFFAAFATYLGKKAAIVVMDCAGWHKSKELNIPDNIEIVYLPPYSPELNPVEKFWQHMKAHVIKNKIYDNLEALEKAVCEFIQQLIPNNIKTTCSINHTLNAI